MLSQRRYPSLRCAAAHGPSPRRCGTAGPAYRARVPPDAGDLAGNDDDLDRANTYYQRAMALGETDADRDRARNCIHRAQYAERDGARLVFYEHGSGEPAIVFINPIVYGLATFEPIFEQLCQEFRVITVDCRGADDLTLSCALTRLSTWRTSEQSSRRRPPLRSSASASRAAPTCLSSSPIGTGSSSEKS